MSEDKTWYTISLPPKPEWTTASVSYAEGSDWVKLTWEVHRDTGEKRNERVTRTPLKDLQA